MADEQGTATAPTTAEPTDQDPTDEQAAAEAEASAAPEYEYEDDGRTRDAWVRGHPIHYEFHDAEYGRIPDSDPPCFERFLMASLMAEVDLIDILNQRLDLYELSGEWNMDTLADADDAYLEQQTERGGIFEDVARLKRLRDVAGACREAAKAFKGLREYVLDVRYAPAEQKLDDLVATVPGWTREDAANLCTLMGLSDWYPHDRDSWVYASRKG